MNPDEIERVHFLRSMFTGKDNKSGDVGRVLWTFLTVALTFLEAHSVYKGTPFDPIAFSTGATAILAGGAGALGLKARTEPGA